MSSVFSGDKTAPLFGILGAATAVFSCIGTAFRTAKSGVGSMGVMLPEQVMKSIVPVVMAGAIYGLINAYIISTGTNCFFDGYANLSSGLALAGLSAMVIGMVGNTGVR